MPVSFGRLLQVINMFMIALGPPILQWGWPESRIQDLLHVERANKEPERRCNWCGPGCKQGLGCESVIWWPRRTGERSSWFHYLTYLTMFSVAIRIGPKEISFDMFSRYHAHDSFDISMCILLWNCSVFIMCDCIYWVNYVSYHMFVERALCHDYQMLSYQSFFLHLAEWLPLNDH